MLDVEHAVTDLSVSAPAEPGELRVLLIADTSAVFAGLNDIVALAGYRVAGHINLFQPAVTQDLEGVVGLLVLPQHQVAGLHWCLHLQAVSPMPVVVMADEVDDELLAQAHDAAIYGCVSRDSTPAMLSAAISLAHRRFLALSKLRAERDRLANQTQQLLQTLENRKLIERAKGIYMRLLGLQESDAHRRLQQESQRRRLSITELARKIIESDELLKPGH